MTRLEKEMLALPSLTQEQLRERWQQLAKQPVPNVPLALLHRLLAQRLQERYLGALPFLVLRELERRASPGSSEPRKAPSLSLNPGTRLVREWNGKTIAVEVREQDFVWEDRSYRSLSQIAKEVTGAHWSGPRFFGLARGS
jgi:hypothetical protein